MLESIVPGGRSPAAAKRTARPCPSTPYRVWPPAGPPGPGAVIDSEALGVHRVAGLHQALASGNLDAAARQIGATGPGLGLFCDSVSELCAVRVARDRLLLVAAAPFAVAPGWHAEGFAFTPIDDGLAVYALTGSAQNVLLRRGTALSPDAVSPCAALFLGGFPAVAYRCQGVLRIHVEASLATGFEAWLRQAGSELAAEPAPGSP